MWDLVWLKYCVISWSFKRVCSVQVAGKMRRGQMVGLQSLVTVNARPSLSTRSSLRRQAVKSSRVVSRIMAVLTSCPKCRMEGSYQPYSAVEDTTALPHITNQPITQWFSVGQEMIGHVAVTVDLGRRWRFVNFWMCHQTVTLISLDLSKFKQRHWPLTWFQCRHILSTRQRYLCEWFCVCAPVCLSESASAAWGLPSQSASMCWYAWLVAMYHVCFVSHCWGSRCKECTW